ncbi:DNA-binding response regulator [Altericroceibacterium spongiae]|uniref:DNA-binding response regulator n=1 Tax=Altericroceibacterium spongiae TaxID=2320269 RepID=A0A420EAE3_9SPHN|nr:response regulator transcription factor [Altericroceibacterium spongiae]RKF17653.1 DNA-binding response regulator [Altericroceibacterium spongiae]
MSDTDKLLAIIEDDEAFARTLRRSFERRGYNVIQARSHDQLAELLKQHIPDFAVVDLKLEASSGLSCVQALREQSETMKIVVLTGYASIATAVEAIKLGANYYLAKPSNTDDIEAAFSRNEEGDTSVEVQGRQSSLKTLEWEHIHQTLMETGFNVSETARRLGMHRRTLARKLEKRQLR